MDPRFLPFIELTEKDYSQDAPQLSLEFKPYGMGDGTSLSLTLPYRLLFTVRRSDTISKPIIFRWNQNNDFYFRCRFILLHETSSGLQQVDVSSINPGKVLDDDADTLQFNGYNGSIKGLPSGGDFSRLGKLSSNYRETLIAGEKYHLFWPGAEIDMFEWGTRAEWQGKELKSQSARETKLPKLLLTASNVISFTPRHEDKPWPERVELEKKGVNSEELNRREADWRREQNPPPPPPALGPEARVPGAPIFTMKLQGPAQVARMSARTDERLEIKIILTYEGTGNPEDDDKAVTFHTDIFTTFPTRGRLECLRGNDWKHCFCKSSLGFRIVDDPDVAVRVGESDLFASLRRGEEWTTQTTLKDGSSWSEFPDDVAVGDKFRFQYRGLKLDWWDWGTKEGSHRETTVMLPCFLYASVIEPRDNNGRLEVVVPATNVVEFTIVE